MSKEESDAGFTPVAQDRHALLHTASGVEVQVQISGEKVTVWANGHDVVALPQGDLSALEGSVM